MKMLKKKFNNCCKKLRAEKNVPKNDTKNTLQHDVKAFIML
jgi:hypothetical protein